LAPKLYARLQREILERDGWRCIARLLSSEPWPTNRNEVYSFGGANDLIYLPYQNLTVTHAQFSEKDNANSEAVYLGWDRESENKPPHDMRGHV